MVKIIIKIFRIRWLDKWFDGDKIPSLLNSQAHAETHVVNILFKYKKQEKQASEALKRRPISDFAKDGASHFIQYMMRIGLFGIHGYINYDGLRITLQP